MHPEFTCLYLGLLGWDSKFSLFQEFRSCLTKSRCHYTRRKISKTARNKLQGIGSLLASLSGERGNSTCVTVNRRSVEPAIEPNSGRDEASSENADGATNMKIPIYPCLSLFDHLFESTKKPWHDEYFQAYIPVPIQVYWRTWLLLVSNQIPAEDTCQSSSGTTPMQWSRSLTSHNFTSLLFCFMGSRLFTGVVKAKSTCMLVDCGLVSEIRCFSSCTLFWVLPPLGL